MDYLYLYCNLWYLVIGTKNMESISNIANGHFNGPKQIRMEYQLSESDGLSS